VTGGPTVLLKLGGELIEDAGALRELARALARVPAGPKLAIVHGGGREIDQALAQAGIPKAQVDGVRVTDAATLQVVVAVLAGTVNTRFVAALNAAGVKAVGLTGADRDVAPVRPAPPLQAADGRAVDLGLVGQPVTGRPPALLATLARGGFVPVVACIGADTAGQLYNVNADTLAASLAARLGVRRLVIAGATAGVLDAAGATIPSLDPRAVARLIASGVANKGMAAKLNACRAAVKAGVREVRIVDGRDPQRLAAAVAGTLTGAGAWTVVSASVPAGPARPRSGRQG
jgi:acetylglutamate kinase